MIDINLIGTWITIAGAILGGIIWAIAKSAAWSRTITSIEKDIADLIKEMEKNFNQHGELYQSRNDMTNIMTRISTLMENMEKRHENMEKRQENMEKKIDTLLERRGVNRGE